MQADEHINDDEELVLRHELALERTRLANERTLLAYLRTAFMLIIAGATVIKLFADSGLAVTSGWVLVGLGLTVTGIGGWRFATVRRSLVHHRWPRRE